MLSGIPDSAQFYLQVTSSLTENTTNFDGYLPQSDLSRVRGMFEGCVGEAAFTFQERSQAELARDLRGL